MSRPRLILVDARHLRTVVFDLTKPQIHVCIHNTGNPPTGRVDLSRSDDGIYVREGDGVILDPLEASASWWILFICVSIRCLYPIAVAWFRFSFIFGLLQVRQGLTFTLAQLLEVIIIDFFCLSSRLFVSVLGNLVTLLSKWGCSTKLIASVESYLMAFLSQLFNLADGPSCFSCGAYWTLHSSTAPPDLRIIGSGFKILFLFSTNRTRGMDNRINLFFSLSGSSSQ